MSEPGSAGILRAGILDGARVAVAGGGPPGLDSELERLGARLAAPADSGEVTVLVFDGAPSFTEGGPDGLMSMLEQGWASVHEVAERLIAGQGPAKVLLIAPRPDAGPLASAAQAALENLARTLSVEWARFAITACAILPGAATTTAQLRELVCFLLSPAGDYFSGCALELAAV